MKNQNYCESNIINQNISELFSKKDIEEMASSKNFEWIKPYTLNEKLKLYIDVKEKKDFNKKDKKLQRSCVRRECKFLRTVVWLELQITYIKYIEVHHKELAKEYRNKRIWDKLDEKFLIQDLPLLLKNFIEEYIFNQDTEIPK
ncbi:20824_t:CDS:2, partial [Cetraspora pellucida]